MKRIGLILLLIVVAMMFIPMIIINGVNSAASSNSPDAGGIINFNFEEKNQKPEPSAEPIIVPYEDLKLKVFVAGKNEIQEMSLEEYLKGVLSAEMPAEFGEEALKAQAVASRTYAVTRIMAFGGRGCKSHPDADICTNSRCCQAWVSKEDVYKTWEAQDASGLWEKIARAVDDTRGMILTYNAAPVMYPLFFSTSSGRTENSEDVFSSSYPYLRSVVSPDEDISPKFTSKVTMTADDFVKKFSVSSYKISLDKSKLKTEVKILSRTEGGSVKSIKVGSKTLEGTDVRTILNLNSANFNIEFGKTDVTISVLGNGHGVGMSQWGANVMAEAGKKFDEILKHYYQDIKIGKIEDVYGK